MKSCIALAGLVVFLCAIFELGLCREDPLIKMNLGGFKDSRASQNSAESIALFAVQEHNKQQNGVLEFARVLNSREQVVAGKIYHLTLEAVDAGINKIYEAKVWVKPWINFKQLQEFKLAHHVPSFTSSDLGLKPDGHGPGWRPVPIHDPEVQDAATHAVQSLQLRSNSLYPYELLEILLAKAKVIEDYARFHLLLKVKRGIQEQKLWVEVNKNIEGRFYSSGMERDR
ncbi:putative Cystatin domain-containing protein [Rosa chinensis]|uniref:Cysteine proteinase inhibitor n=1 Tax=Rosa chinensis TaxID=74649 RepID=A0A2P6RH42_ROSCH|nr:cysteine proteinase inhibitor 12 isoform X1 [Rosa chinensis]PRQ45744.1 putative Cystatin domain-containing protein [Rosa chinensis]